MPAFKSPGFQERQEAAQRAKGEALTRYKARPKIDESVLAERMAKRLAREVVDAEKRAAILRAKEEAAESKREQERAAVAAAETAAIAEAEAEARARADATAQKAAERKLWTEDDRKAARDARYAARKMRKTRNR